MSAKPESRRTVEGPPQCLHRDSRPPNRVTRDGVLRPSCGVPRFALQRLRRLRMTVSYPINPGGIPFIILPNFLAPKPLEKLRIIFFICRYCFRS